MSTLRAFDVYVKRQVEQLIVIPVNAKDEKEAAKFVNLGIADLDNVEVEWSLSFFFHTSISNTCWGKHSCSSPPP